MDDSIIFNFQDWFTEDEYNFSESTYLEPFDDPCFGSSLGLVLEGSRQKIEDKQVPGMYMYIYTSYS